MKKIIVLLSLLTVLSCQTDKLTEPAVEYIIAPQPTMLVKFSDFSGWKEALSQQSFLSKNQNNDILTFWSAEIFEQIIDIPDNAVISFSNLGNNKTIKTLSFDSPKNIQLKVETKQSYQYDEMTIKAFESSDNEVYSTSIGGKMVFCTSKIILENIIRNYKNGIKNSPQILKLLDVLSDKSPSLILNTNTFPKVIFQFFDENILKSHLDLSDYSGFDINLSEDKVFLSGIVFNPEKEEKFWTKFKTVNPQKPTTVEVIPSNFKTVKSVLFSDFQKLFTAAKSVDQQPTIDSLFVNIREISSVNLSKGQTTILASNDINQTFEHLKINSTPQKTIGDTKIYQLNTPLELGKEFKTIIDPLNAKFFTVHLDYVLFSDAIGTVENLIIQINNKNVIANKANYNNHLESLNSECHVQWLTNLGNQKDFFDEHSTEDYKASFSGIKWNNHELLMSQLIVEEDFGYLNILHKKTIENQKNVSIEQLVRLKSENTIIGIPAFFKNWRTGQQDVVYQDDQNVLHLKDTKGNLIWSKKLNNAIIGEISSIDIYQNKRIQMAFATKDKIHIIDKNGNDVKPFPIEFKDEITQELSVFDYDNNGEYRFTIVFDDDIKMYDKEAKQVRGFKFRKTKTPITTQAKHIRMGNKDYILAQEQSGTLHILNRRGKTRIDLDKNFKSSDNQWFENNNLFTSISEKGEILRIDQNGNLTRQTRDYLNPKFSANKSHLVVLSENKFYFNSKETELPYGLYTNPVIDKNYAGIADKQAQKIYILNKNAEIVEGFPIYGEELLDFYSNDNEIEILCKDGNKALIIYKAKFK